MYVCMYVCIYICMCSHTYVMKICRTLRTGARFSSKFAGRSARERDFRQNLQDAPHGSAIFIQICRTLRTGARFSSKFSVRSAPERDFGQKRTILSGSVWYRLNDQNSKDESDESYTKPIPKRRPKNLPLEKINRRNFEDVSSGSAIFED